MDSRRLQKEMDMINKAFIETMIEGDAEEEDSVSYPTYSITKDFDWSDTENNKLLFEMTSKYGTPYFQICEQRCWNQRCQGMCCS